MTAYAADAVIESEFVDSMVLEDLKEKSTAYTIDLDVTAVNEDYVSALNENEYAEFQKEASAKHNAVAVKEAKKFVDSLNLAEQGYGYIKESCYKELDYYATMEEARLISYTVYLPNVENGAVVRSSPSEGELYNLGTYGGRAFYYYYPSSATVVSNIKKQTSKSVLQQWASNLVTCLISFDDVSLNAAWSAIQVLMGAPSGYEIKTGAFTEHYCNLKIYTRGIYTLHNNSYQMCTSQQYAQVYPYSVFHPVDPPTYNAAYSKDYGYQGIVTSPKYNMTRAQLCQEAYQAYNGAYVTSQYDTLSTNQLTTVWQ